MLRLLRLTLLVLSLSLFPTESVRGADDKAGAPAIEVTVDTSECPELAEWAKKAKSLVESWHPRIVKLLPSEGFKPPTRVKLVFRKRMRGLAYTSGSTIVISARWLKEQPEDYGMVVHELTHVVQAYPGADPGWLIEGIADYVRFFHYEPKTKIEVNPERASYRDGYRTTARFLAWVEQKKDRDIVRVLNAALRQGKYNDELFRTRTGKSLDALWAAFIESVQAEQKTVTSLRAADSEEWTDLTDLKSWQGPTDDWLVAESVQQDSQNPRRLSATPGKDILVNGKKGRAHDLLSKQKLGDLEVHLEFLIPRGSNSGVKLEGLYEIQISDSHGKKHIDGSDCGGIYPRAELTPTYHHIDKGIAPKVNAARPAGEWQTLEITFTAPRFDRSGKKTANARFVKVVLNGKVIHEDVELASPTGHAWHDKEVAAGPLLLQGDHGPVAFRKVRVRPWKAAAASSR